MATAIDIAVTTTTYNVSITAEPNEYIVNITTNSGGGGVQSVTGTTVDNTDPLNPVVNVPTLDEVLNEGATSDIPIVIEDSASSATIGVGFVEVRSKTTDAGVSMSEFGLEIWTQNQVLNAIVKSDNISEPYTTQFPNKIGGAEETFAMLSDIPTIPVDSVNGQTGVVVLDAADVGAEPTKGSDDNYVTDAQLVVIGNTSGTNSGDNATNTTSNAYADAKVADTIADGVTTVAPSQNAVFDALALKQNNLVLGKKGNASSPVTGTTTETILESIFIPAGSVAVNDIIYIRNRVFKTGATGGFTVRYRINSSNSISGSSVLGFATLGAGSIRSQGLERTLNLRASNTIEVVDNTTSIAYENTSISNANVNITFTFTSDFWILITGQLTGVADSIVNSNYIIQKF